MIYIDDCIAGTVCYIVNHDIIGIILESRLSLIEEKGI
jgi:hypothetical protein